VALAPAAVLLLCSFAADEVAVAGRDRLGIWGLLPAGPVGGNWITAELSSFALFFVAIALARGKRIGFWLGLAAMAGAVIVQGLHFHHPLAAAAAVAVALILVATRSRYDVATPDRETVVAGGLVGIGGALVVAGVVLTVHGAATARMGVDAVGAVFDVATPLPIPGLAALGAALIVARIAYLGAAVIALDPAGEAPSPAELAAATHALLEHGAGSLLPYQERPPCVPVTDAAGRAVLAVAVAGRGAVVLGDPAGDPAAAQELLADWSERTRRQDQVPIVYQASRGLAGRLGASGWTTVRIGSEAILNPVAFDLGSSRVANLRHTTTRARKGGLSCRVSTDGAILADPVTAAALTRIDAAWRRRGGPQLGFTVGRFDATDTRPSLVAIALDADESPCAFLVLRPTGADGGWMLDILRRAPGTTPGAIDLCLVEAIRSLGEAGVRRLSLGLVPLGGLSPTEGSPVERGLALAARALTPVYDVRGLTFFKNKVDPDWVPRFLVVPRWWNLVGAGVALLRLHLGGSWRAVGRSLAAALPTR
jgi:lysyl-tRNA synthetase class 2